MDDRELVQRLLELGVIAFRKDPYEYANPSNDPLLRDIGPATIATWLEEMARYRLIGEVQPQFTRTGAGFLYRVTKEADLLWSNEPGLDRLLNRMGLTPRDFDVFISYASQDAALATELRDDLQRHGLKCFMAEKDIAVASEWQETIRDALRGSKRVLILLTPRSLNRPWVLMETGAAWAIGIPLIPALVQVSPSELIDPIRRHQARVIETRSQRQALVEELTALCVYNR